MARKILVTRRDFVQDPAAVLGGGFWTTGNPIINILDPRPQKVAEAISTNSAATTFGIDLGYQRLVGLFFFANLRTTSMGVMRIRSSLSADMSNPTYDVETTTWPQDTIAGENNVWGEWSLNGVYASEEYEKIGMTRFFIPSTPVLARYVMVEVYDYTASSPLQIGCFGACEVWESPIEFAPAPQITIIDESDIQTITYGSSYVNQRGLRNRFNFGFPAIEKDEMLNTTLGMLRIKGKSQPVVIVSFPDEGNSLEKTSVYGLINHDAVISNPFLGYYAHPIQVDQLI